LRQASGEVLPKFVDFPILGDLWTSPANAGMKQAAENASARSSFDGSSCSFGS